MKRMLKDMRYEFGKHRFIRRGQRLSQRLPIEKMEYPIDFVVTWVDGNDPQWQAERNKRAKECGMNLAGTDNGEERYRDWDLLYYWFRAVEVYAPWVRNIYFVTCGQIPEWMNTEAPKLKIVNHRDFIPEKYLPVFSCNPIELNLHRIDGISEHFVYFNDDIFLAKPVSPEDFFRGEKPVYTALAQPIYCDANSAFYHMQFSTVSLINKYFQGRIVNAMVRHPERWFSVEYGDRVRFNQYLFETGHLPGMYFSHLGVPLRKSTMEKIWQEVPEAMEDTCTHPFRSPHDIIHQIFSIWEMIDGDFCPASIEHHGMHFWNPSAQKEKIIEAILNQQYRMICINDSPLVTREAYKSLKSDIQLAFEKALPDKSSYEKQSIR